MKLGLTGTDRELAGLEAAPWQLDLHRGAYGGFQATKDHTSGLWAGFGQRHAGQHLFCTRQPGGESAD